MADEVLMKAERLGEWGHVETPAASRVDPRFEVKWPKALDDLCREVRLIGGREFVLQLDCRAKDIGRSGWLLGNDGADVACTFPGVRITIPSRHGTLVYACDNYHDPSWGRRYLRGWQANVRAITLTLEALRAIDRYGSARHGEQYAGFRAIGDGRQAIPMTSSGWTPETASEWLAAQAAVVGVETTGGGLLADAELLRRVRRDLLSLAHPDRGGDEDQFKRLNAAFAALGL